MNADANLRSGPGTTFSRVGTAQVGEQVVIVGRNAEGDWYVLDSGAWIAAFLVNNVASGVPVLLASSVDSGMNASVTSSLATPTPGLFVLDFTQWIGKSRNDAESILGQPTTVIEMDPNDLESLPFGGTSNDYLVNGFWVTGDFDRQGILRSLWMSDTPNSIMGYQIPRDEWKKVLAAVGLPTNQLPDVDAPMGMHWNNLAGFKVRLVALPEGDEVIWWLIVVMEAR